MGSGQSKPTTSSSSSSSSSDNNNKSQPQKVVCENCDKKTQKPAPEESIVSEGMTCSEAYKAVSACMTKNDGQISACSKEWDVFRACHDNNKQW